MKAIVYKKYGTPDVLELKEIAKPVPKEDEVLIKVCAVSINDWDLGLLMGADLINRLLNGLFKPKIKILGSDVAGRIEAIGSGVKKFQAGNEVYGDLSGTWGGFAEYVCAKENSLCLKPVNMSFVEAASIPQAALLALQGLCDRGQIKSGQKLLINGAGGGVGTFAIQIARLYCAEVTGVDSPGKLEMMRSIGYDHVINYEQEDFTKSGQRYDLIIDVKTNHFILDYTRVLNRNGIYVIVGGSPGRLLEALFLIPFIYVFLKKHIRFLALKPNKDLAYISKLYDEGKIKPVIDGPYNLNEFQSAFMNFNKGMHSGKVVIMLEDN